MNYDLLDICDVSVRSYGNETVMLTVATSGIGTEWRWARGKAYTGEGRLEAACDDACRILCGWAAVGELAVAQICAEWVGSAT
jgi:hypothetical protein